MRVLLFVSQRSIDGWYPDSNNKQASKQPNGSSGKPRPLKMAPCFSESRPVEEHSKARVYGSSNLHYSSCRVLNVMRKCQPTGKFQFLTRFAIIRSSWGCTDVWRALMECQRKGQAMQILFVQPNQKSHKGNYPFAESMPPSPCLFFWNSKLWMSLTKTFSTTSARIPAGRDHTLLQPTSQDDVCRWTKWFYLFPQRAL